MSEEARYEAYRKYCGMVGVEPAAIDEWRRANQQVSEFNYGLPDVRERARKTERRSPADGK